MERSDIEALAKLYDAVPVKLDEQGVRHLQAGPEWTAYEAHLNLLIADVKARLVYMSDFQSFTMAQIHVAAKAIVNNLVAALPPDTTPVQAPAAPAPTPERTRGNRRQRRSARGKR